MSRLYEIKDSPGKGKGAFALQDIQRGTRIIAETPAFIIEARTGLCNPKLAYEGFQTLDPITRAQYMTWTSTGIRDPKNLAEYQQLSRIWMDESKYTPQQKAQAVQIASIFDNNAFDLEPENAQRKGAAGICLEATRINHSCLPNACHSWDPSKNQLTVHALRNISKGEEILTTYVDPRDPRDIRQLVLQYQYGFGCNCVACDVSTPFGQQSTTRRAEMHRLHGLLKGKDAMEGENWSTVYVARMRQLLRLAEEEGVDGVWKINCYAGLSAGLWNHGERAEAIAEQETAVDCARLCCGADSAVFAKESQELEALKADK